MFSNWRFPIDPVELLNEMLLALMQINTQIIGKYMLFVGVAAMAAYGLVRGALHVREIHTTRIRERDAEEAARQAAARAKAEAAARAKQEAAEAVVRMQRRLEYLHFEARQAVSLGANNAEAAKHIADAEKIEAILALPPPERDKGIRKYEARRQEEAAAEAAARAKQEAAAKARAAQEAEAKAKADAEAALAARIAEQQRLYSEMCENKENDAYGAARERWIAKGELVLTPEAFLVEMEDARIDPDNGTFANDCFYEENKRWAELKFPNPWIKWAKDRREYQQARAVLEARRDIALNKGSDREIALAMQALRQHEHEHTEAKGEGGGKC